MNKQVSRKSLASMVGHSPYAFAGMTVRPLFGALYLVKYTETLWAIDKCSKNSGSSIATFAAEPTAHEIDAAIDSWIKVENYRLQAKSVGR
jgi:hypothetical protein